MVALFPLVMIYARHTSEVSLSELVLPAIITLLVIFVVWRILLRVFQSRGKAGILAFMVSCWLVSFKPLDYVLEGLRMGATPEGRENYILAAGAVALVAGFWIINSSRRPMRLPNVFLNVVTVAQMAVLLLNAVLAASSPSGHQGTLGQSEAPDLGAARYTGTDKPDIYYIILDGYGRSDVLREVYSVDNSRFLAFLENNGFYVAGKSTANYSQTYLSIASSLNLTHLNKLAKTLGETSESLTAVISSIQHSEAARFLRAYGYTVAAFSSGYSGTEIRKADCYLAPAFNLSEYQQALINMTPVSALLRLPPIRNSFQIDAHRNRILYTLEKLSHVSEARSPKFVFAHVFAPHPPFVFDQDGKAIHGGSKWLLNDGVDFLRNATVREYVEGYREQVTFLTRRLQETVSRLLAASPDAIIILQGDHGPGSTFGNFTKTDMRERMGILNAYRVPTRLRERFYEDMTPVNTFRVIFEGLFNARYERLPDRAYFSTVTRPYKFYDVTATVTSGASGAQ